MTTFNTDYNNTELLDQELSLDELQEINGGGPAIVAVACFLGLYFLYTQHISPAVKAIKS
ncbi:MULTISPECIES: hypothetical protein [unclassified Prochlorococcus]|uniref:hypothetical protein n=1 Tax=unclassified Prochlorococcus TaxID=2627481 RepID=UPI0039A4C948